MREHRPAPSCTSPPKATSTAPSLVPDAFIRTNVQGTFTLLEQARSYWSALRSAERQARFRFLHVSTDEVYGSLGPGRSRLFRDHAYAPNSPYAASKAASDHLVRAYLHTYGLPALTTNCSNNYGPFQFPEKLIPLMILNALEGKPLPVYGDGRNVRDWLYVGDHCAAIRAVLRNGPTRRDLQHRRQQRAGQHRRRPHHLRPGRRDCAPMRHWRRARKLITFVTDRPGHDRRYAIDASQDRPRTGLAARRVSSRPALRQTVAWYLEHPRLGRERPHRQLTATGSARTTRRGLAAYEGHHSRRRFRHAALSRDPCRLQAALPVYDKPMIYYPLSTLMLAGIRDILIISTPQDTPRFAELLGDGTRWGINLQYAVQPSPDGLAQAFLIGRDFIGGDACALVLGDNIFYGQSFSRTVAAAAAARAGRHRLRLSRPGSRALRRRRVRRRKAAPSASKRSPQNPKSRYAVTGLYFYDNECCRDRRVAQAVGTRRARNHRSQSPLS